MKREIKTIQQWLEEWQATGDPNAALVIKYARNEDSTLHVNSYSLSEAIAGSFVWSDTPEGQQHWANVARSVRYLEEKNARRGY